ncbi:MAG TPA: hypothetical protein VNZ67_08370, partial [bacterium]|nr:hypothetical protein [bacterium]
YEGLAPHYQDHPNIAQIALRRADYLRKNHPLAFVKKAKSPAKAGKAKSKSKPPRKRRAA